MRSSSCICDVARDLPATLQPCHTLTLSPHWPRPWRRLPAPTHTRTHARTCAHHWRVDQVQAQGVRSVLVQYLRGVLPACGGRGRETAVVAECRRRRGAVGGLKEVFDGGSIGQMMVCESHGRWCGRARARALQHSLFQARDARLCVVVYDCQSTRRPRRDGAPGTAVL